MIRINLHKGNRNRCRKRLWISLNIGFVWCSISLIDPCICCCPLPVFFCLPLAALRGHSCVLCSCDLLWHESFTASSYHTPGCDELIIHPTCPMGRKGILTVRVRKSLAFDFIVVVGQRSDKQPDHHPEVNTMCQRQACTSVLCRQVVR